MVSVSEVRRAPHGSFIRVEFQDQKVAGNTVLMVNESVSGNQLDGCDDIDASLCPQVIYGTSLKTRLFEQRGSTSLYGPSIRVDVVRTDSQTSPETLVKATIFYCYHVRGGSALWCGDELPVCKVSPKGWCDVAFKEEERRR